MRWGFFVIIKMVKGQFYNLICIHIIKKKKGCWYVCCTRQCKGNLRAFQVKHTRSFGDQKPPFIAAFELSRHPYRAEMTCVAYNHLIWRWQTFFSLSSLIFAHFPLKFQSSSSIRIIYLEWFGPFFLLVIVLFGIIYKNRILFNFIPLQFFLSFTFSPHSFYCHLFCLR
jgi:hypothetical protein